MVGGATKNRYGAGTKGMPMTNCMIFFKIAYLSQNSLKEAGYIEYCSQTSDHFDLQQLV